MVCAFARPGQCVSVRSRWLGHRLGPRRFGVGAGWVFVATIAGLSGFGVYLGRYPRWNSWDVVARPGELLADLAAHVRDPEPRALGMTLMMAALFGIAYLMLFALTTLGPQERATSNRQQATGNGRLPDPELPVL
jgi:hypothetical protein